MSSSKPARAAYEDKRMGTSPLNRRPWSADLLVGVRRSTLLPLCKHSVYYSSVSRNRSWSSGGPETGRPAARLGLECGDSKQGTWHTGWRLPYNYPQRVRLENTSTTTPEHKRWLLPEFPSAHPPRSLSPLRSLAAIQKGRRNYWMIWF